jgi:peptidyl-prolyl cis-trans isomerase C
MKIRVITLLSILGTVMLAGCTDGKPIAKVNGRSISEDQFQAYLKLKRVPQQDKARVDRMFDDYLEREAITEAIEKSDLLDHLTIEAELREFKKQILISRYMERYLIDTVNEEAVRNYYAANPEQYESRQIKASHILIRTNPKISDNERQALLTKAHEIYSKVKSGGDFGKLADEFSEDRVSGKKGGDLGWLKEGAIDPEFSKRVFAMKAGDISEPFATTFGFHIVRVDEDLKTVKRPYEKVSGDIRYQLRQQAKDAEYKRIIDAAKIKKY